MMAAPSSSNCNYRGYFIADTNAIVSGQYHIPSSNLIDTTAVRLMQDSRIPNIIDFSAL